MEFPDEDWVLETLDALLSEGAGSLRAQLRRSIARGDFSVALKVANEDYASAGAQDVERVLTYATLLVARGLYDEAFAITRKALLLAPDSVALQVFQCVALVESGARESAAALISGLREVGSLTAPQWTLLGGLCSELGEDDDARACFLEALDGGSDDAGVALALANLYLDDDDPLAAANMFEQAGRLAPNRADVWETAGHAWLSLEEFDRAVAAYRRVVRLDPDHSQAWMNIGVALRESGNSHEALDAFEKASRLSGESITSWLNLGHCQLQIGFADEAQTSYRRASELDPENGEAWHGLVASAFELGDLDRALELADQAVEVDPGNPDAHYNLGVILLSLNRPADAHDAFEVAYELDPAEVRYASSLPLSLLRQGLVAEAMEGMAALADSEAPWHLVEFAESLIRYADQEAVRGFLAATEHPAPQWAAMRALLHLVVEARAGQPIGKWANDILTVVRRFPEVVPVDWDFDEILAFARPLADDLHALVTLCVDILEGRRDVAEATRLFDAAGDSE